MPLTSTKKYDVEATGGSIHRSGSRLLRPDVAAAVAARCGGAKQPI